MRGKKIVLFSLLLMLSVLSVSATLEASAQKVVLQINSYIAYVDDIAISLDTAPFVHEGRTMVPLRMIADAFGYETSWDASAKKVTIVGDDNTIELIIGQSVAIVNGELFFIDGTAIISEGKTMVPIRFISEVMSYRVDWNQTTKIITIRTPPAPIGGSSQTTSTTRTEEITGVIDIDIRNILSNQPATYELNYESTAGSTEGLHVDLYRQTVTGGTYSMSLSSLEVKGGINPEFEEWITSEYTVNTSEIAKEFVASNSFSSTPKNKLTLNYTVHTNGRLVSVLAEYYESANPRNIKVETRTFDVEAGVELSLQDLFLEEVKAEPLIIRNLNQLAIQLSAVYPEMGSFTIEKVSHFYVAGDKIIFIYEPYELTSTYAGVMQYNIMYSTLKSYLKPEYFGEYVVLPTMEEKIRAQQEAEEAERLKNAPPVVVEEPSASMITETTYSDPYEYIPQENDYEDFR